MMEGRNSSLRNDIYTCQLFRFTSRSFTDYLFSFASREVTDALNEIHSLVKQQPFYKDVPEEKLDKLRKYYRERLELNFDRLEIFLEDHILKVPSNVVLPEDKVQEQDQTSVFDLSTFENEISSIKNKIMSSFYTRVSMEKELSELENIQENANQILERMNKCIMEAGDIFNEENVKQLHKDAETCIDVFTEMVTSDQNLDEANDLPDSVCPSAKRQRTT